MIKDVTAYPTKASKEERKEFFISLLKGGIRLVLLIVVVSWLQEYFDNDGSHLVSALSRIPGSEFLHAIQMLSLAGIICAAMGIGILAILFRWSLIHKRIFWVLFSATTNCLFIYIFPEFGQAICLALLE